MKENSIEEDILNIEKYVELVIDKNYCDCNELNVICAGNHGDGSKNVAYSIQHILSDYKRVLKENEELKNEVMEKDLEIIGKVEYTEASMKEIIEQYYTANEDCITKQRIEDIIDRIDYDIKKTKEIMSNDRRNNYQITRLKAMNTKSLDIKKRLQKLLESEE